MEFKKRDSAVMETHKVPWEHLRKTLSHPRGNGSEIDAQGTSRSQSDSMGESSTPSRENGKREHGPINSQVWTGPHFCFFVKTTKDRVG